MRVVEATWEEVRSGVGDGVASATTRWRERRGLWLRLRDETGQRGWGEASPLPGYSPDGIEDARATLSRVPYRELGDVSLAVDPVGEVDRWLSPVSSPSPSARFAIETALFDLMGQRLGIPLHRLLAGDRAAPDDLPLCALIATGDTRLAARVARDIRSRGYAAAKMKVGGSGANLDRARAVREALGDDVELRLDANGCLPEAAWQRVVDAFAEVRPELFEEPVDASIVARGPQPRVPLAVDESMHRPERFAAIEESTRRGCYRAWVLKPGVLGGIIACLRRAERARSLGIDAIVSHLFEGPIALAASAELALAVGSPRAAGLAPHAGLSAWPPLELSSIRDGRLVAHHQPGLGLIGGGRG